MPSAMMFSGIAPSFWPFRILIISAAGLKSLELAVPVDVVHSTVICIKRALSYELCCYELSENIPAQKFLLIV